MSQKWIVSPTAWDCLGNVGAYMVARYTWKPDRNSQRADGLALSRDVAGTFVANLYEEGSHADALRKAEALRDAMNAKG